MSVLDRENQENTPRAGNRHALWNCILGLTALTLLAGPKIAVNLYDHFALSQKETLTVTTRAARPATAGMSNPFEHTVIPSRAP